MAITINDITSGMALLVEGEIYGVVEYHHVKPGKGSAFVRVRLKNIKTDAVLERTFRSADKLDEVPLEENELEYLYRQEDNFYFMDHTSYEEVPISQKNLGEGVEEFLLENLVVTGIYCNNKLVKVVLPNFIITQVIESEPGIRGDSTRPGTKPGKIPTGASIQIPLFINTGDWIKIDTRTRGYVERVQK